MSAITAAYRAGVAEFRDPGSAQGGTAGGMAAEYDLRWAYYENDASVVYGSARMAQLRQADRALYTYTRFIVNPVRPVVSFYKDHLFPAEAEQLKSGASLATPVAEGADDKLKEAIAQVDQWTNWLGEALRMTEIWAALGEVLVEVVDDLPAEKITHRIVEPKYIASVTTDAAGNVKAYALEYKAYDAERKEHYTFRKEVDGENFRYFRDGKPFDPPEREGDTVNRVTTGVYDNPYTFVPAVWAKHIDRGTYGDPAFWNYEKVDEANSALSHSHDHIHKAIEAGKLISTSGEIMAVIGASGTSKRNESGGVYTAGYDSRFDWQVFKAPENSSVSDLGSVFDLTQADPYVSRILEGFIGDYAELQAAKLIEEHGATSGEALKLKLGKAQSRLDQAAANINPQVIKLKQMAVAMGGMRANAGDWTSRDAQHDVFRQFNLESWKQGKLNFSLRRPLLVKATPMEEEELKAKKMERAKSAQGMVDDVEQLVIAGYSQERAEEIVRNRQAQGGSEGGAAA